MFLVVEQKLSLTVGKRADAAPHCKVLLCGMRTLYFLPFLYPNMIGISSNSVSKISEIAIYALSTSLRDTMVCFDRR